MSAPTNAESNPATNAPASHSPMDLAQLQREMAAAVMQPLTPDENMRATMPDGRSTTAVAASFIAPNSRLTADWRFTTGNIGTACWALWLKIFPRFARSSAAVDLKRSALPISPSIPAVRSLCATSAQNFQRGLRLIPSTPGDVTAWQWTWRRWSGRLSKPLMRQSSLR